MGARRVALGLPAAHLSGMFRFASSRPYFQQELTMRAPLVSTLQRTARTAAFVALTLASLSGLAAAQDTASAEARTAYLGQLEEMHEKFVQLAEAFPADKYAWRPAAGVRSVGEVFMHVATEYYLMPPMAFSAAPSPTLPPGRESYGKLEKDATKEHVLQALKEGHAYTTQALQGIDADSLGGTRNLFGHEFTGTQRWFLMAGDLHEHLGQLIAYARMNGVKPPWSK
jgi:hypothetical protein